MNKSETVHLSTLLLASMAMCLTSCQQTEDVVTSADIDADVVAVDANLDDPAIEEMLNETSVDVDLDEPAIEEMSDEPVVEEDFDEKLIAVTGEASEPTWLVRTRAVLDGSSSLWDWDVYGVRDMLGIDNPQTSAEAGQMSQYVNSALSAFFNDMLELSDHYCDKAMALDSSAWKPYAIKGLILDEQQDVLAAINYYNQAYELNVRKEPLMIPGTDTLSYPMLMNRLANDYAQVGRYQESIILLQEILMSDSKNIDALNGLISVYIKDKQYEKAEKWIGKLLDSHQDILHAYGHLAQLALLRGNKQGAIECYEKCLEIDPDNLEAINALYNLYLYSNRARALELKKQAEMLQGQ